MSTPHQPEQLMTTAQVSAACGIDPKTVAHWAATGRLKVACKTLGGHRRFRESDVRAVLQEAAVIDRTPVSRDKPPLTATEYLYKQIAEHIATQISRGDLRPDDVLPGERVLAEHYGTSKTTVRRALRELRERKLVVTLIPKGTVVLPERGAT